MADQFYVSPNGEIMRDNPAGPDDKVRQPLSKLALTDAERTAILARASTDPVRMALESFEAGNGPGKPGGEVTADAVADAVEAADAATLARIQSSVSGGAIVTTWGARPSADSVAVGTEIVLSDYRRQRVYSDGAKWIPVGGRLLVYSRVGSVVTPLSSVTVGAGVTAIPLPGGAIIQEGMIANGSTISIRLRTRKNGASGGVLSITLGTTGTSADSAIIQFQHWGANNIDTLIAQQILVGDDGVVTGAGNSFQYPATGSGIYTTYPITRSAPLHVCANIINAAVGDVLHVISVDVAVEA